MTLSGSPLHGRRGWHTKVRGGQGLAGVLTVVVAAAVGARAHGHHPAGLGHLVIHLSQRGGHLVGKSARNNHAVRLAWAGAENDAEAVKVVARRAWGGAKGGRREGRLCFQAEECSQRCKQHPVSSTDVLQVCEALRLCLPQLLPLWLLSAQQAACQAAAPVCIISTAQQARPKVIGQMEPLRALQHADHTANEQQSGVRAARAAQREGVQQRGRWREWTAPSPDGGRVGRTGLNTGPPQEETVGAPLLVTRLLQPQSSSPSLANWLPRPASASRHRPAASGGAQRGLDTGLAGRCGFRALTLLPADLDVLPSRTPGANRGLVCSPHRPTLSPRGLVPLRPTHQLTS